MKRILIDKNEALSFLREYYSGFANFTYAMINKNNLDDRFDEAYQLCEDIFDGLMNAVETAEVVEERKTAHCIISSYMPGNYLIYSYCCSECGKSVESSHADEEFKFCAYCGAEYTDINIFIGGSNGKSKYLS